MKLHSTVMLHRGEKTGKQRGRSQEEALKEPKHDFVGTHSLGGEVRVTSTLVT